MSLLADFLRRRRLMLVLLVLLMLLEVGSGLMIPTMTAELINRGLEGTEPAVIVRGGCLMAAASLLAGLGALAGSYLTARLAAELGRYLRNRLYDHVLRFSEADMEHFGTGSMVTRTLSDVNVVQQALVMLALMVLPVPVVCLLGIGLSFYLDATMGWLMLGVTLVLLPLMVVVLRLAAPCFVKLQLFLDRMNTVVREVVTGVRVIRAFNKEEHEVQRMETVFRDYRGVAVKANRLFAGMESTALLLVNVMLVVILYVCGVRTGAGAMEMGDLAAVSQYAVLVLFFLMMAQMVMVMMPRAGVCLRRIREVLEYEPSIQDGEDAPGAPMCPALPLSGVSPAPSASGVSGVSGVSGAARLSGEALPVMRFRSVCFRYPDAEEDTLHDIDFSSRRGETTAIIGSTGCGKSTIAKLMLRFLDVTSGAVELFGTDVRRLRQADLRARVACVPQRSWLFSGTIAENLSYGLPGASPQRMREALRMAQAQFVEELPEGLDARVAQGGTNFSGGQRQRLAIARALMKPADLFLFDDSFSALDVRTDAALRRALREGLRDAAVLVIAQRISSIAHADRIVVLEDGRMVGCGRHAELMESCAVYREIARSQMRREEDCSHG